MKMYLLTVKLPIERKCAYWMKMCLLKSHNPLGINSSSYSFGNFFSISSLSSFLETQKICRSSPKLLFVEPNKLGSILGTNLW